MTNALRAALNEKRGYDATKGTIDAAEVEAINSTISRIEEMLLGVADANTTRDTKAIVEVVELMLPDLLENLPGNRARALRKSYDDGNAVTAGNGIDPQLVKKVEDLEKEKENLAKQVEELQNAATGNTGGKPLGLGTATGLDAKLETVRQLGESNPIGLDFVIKMLEVFAKLTDEQQVERSIVAGKVINGTDDYEVVKDTTNGGVAPKLLVDAYATIKAKQDALDATTNSSDATALAEANKKLDPSVKDSVGWKAAQYDADHNMADVNSLANKAAWLDHERDETKTDSLAWQLAQAQAAAKALPDGVSDAFKAVRTAVNNISGIGVRHKDDAVNAVNVLGKKLTGK